MKIDIEIDTTEAENDDIIHSTPRLKRRKSDDSTVTKCIICDKQYHVKVKRFSVFVRWKEQSYL